MVILYVVRELLEGGVYTLLVNHIDYFSKKDEYIIFLIATQPIDKKKELYNILLSNNIKILEPTFFQTACINFMAAIILVFYFPIKIPFYLAKKKRDISFFSTYENIKSALFDKIFPMILFLNSKLYNVDVVHSIGKILDLSIFSNKSTKIIFSEVEDPINRKMNKIKFTNFLESCSSIITPSYIIKEKLLLFSNNISKKINIVPWLIKEQKLPEIKKTNANILTIGVSGRLNFMKGYHVLIEALNEVNKDYNNWKLVIAGDGEEKDSLLKMINDFNLTDKVFFLGWVSNINSFFSEIDLFIHPSFSEGMPMVIIESMYNSKPIIATDVGSVYEMFDESCGFIIPPRSKDALVDKISFFLKNQEEIKNKGISSKLNYDKKFSSNVILNKLEIIYQEVLSEKEKK